jgi:NTP pyrophosphatase (non-canonical NTP hydrolase)
MIDKRKYLTEDGKIDWQKFDLLTEDEQIEIKETWGDSDWQRWYDRFGYWTIEEFDEILKEITIKACFGNGSDNISEGKGNLG